MHGLAIPFKKNGGAGNMNFDTSNVNSQIAACTQVQSQYGPLLNLGVTKDVNGDYTKMMNALKSAGFQAIQDEYMSQAQAFMKDYAANAGSGN